MKVRVSLKSHISGFLISSSALFSRQAKALEDENSPAATEMIHMQHRSYTIGAVMSAATFLEAAINELFQKAIDKDPYVFLPEFDARLREAMAASWDDVEEFSILGKYQIALSLTGKQAFPKGESPYQEADDLVRLRNALVHYKPEWDTDLQEHKKIEDRLRSRNIPENPLISSGATYLPHRCLSHGLASWAVKSACAFYSQFVERMGLPKTLVTTTFSDPANLATE